MPDYAVNEDQLLGWVDSLSNWGRWGDDDELGTLNNLSPELTKRALALVEDGTTVSCAAPLTFNQAELDVPRPPVHYMVGAGEAYRPGDGPGRQVAMDFFGLIFHGHTVTHLDSHAHFMWDGYLYNGRPSSSVKIREGATEGDITIAHKGIVTRGILVDAARGRGVDFIERGDLAAFQRVGKQHDFSRQQLARRPFTGHGFPRGTVFGIRAHRVRGLQDAREDQGNDEPQNVLRVLSTLLSCLFS